LRLPRPKLTYANVVSTLALFGVIAGGTAIALPGKGSVHADDIRRDAVRAKQIRDGKVGAAEIGDGSVGSAEVGDAAIGSTEVAEDAIGLAAIAAGAVGSSEIADGAIRAADVGDGAITSAGIGADAVTDSEIVSTQFDPVTLANGWSTYSLVIGPLEIGKDPLGFVHMRGAIHQGNTALPDRAFTLPAALRPPRNVSFIALATGGLAAITIQADGDGNLIGLGGDFEDLSTLDEVTYYAGP
jgi:hypothetical protein